jgi:hypothetical protein
MAEAHRPRSRAAGRRPLVPTERTSTSDAAVAFAARPCDVDRGGDYASAPWLCGQGTLDLSDDALWVVEPRKVSRLGTPDKAKVRILCDAEAAPAHDP